MPKKTDSKARSRPSAAQLDADADRLGRLAADPALISGIYNYCDRWCERCAFTTRCLTFKIQSTRDSQRSGRRDRQENDNEAFWNDVSQSFALAMRLVQGEARKRGIDLDALKTDPATHLEERRRERLAARQGRPLRRAASAYTKAALALLKRLQPELEAAEDALNTQARLGAAEPHVVAAQIADALEVVEWYVFFIDVKLERAVASRVDPMIDRDEAVPSDADGSAKIALIAIDRSIGAWVRLREHLTAEPDATLDLLVQLEQLRRAVERHFPLARAFKRPGFDG